MRRICAGGAALLIALCGSASAEAVFSGVIKFTAVSNCQHQFAGSISGSNYHPNVSGNDNVSAISVVYDFGLFGYSLNGGAFTTTFKAVTGVNYGWYFSTFAARVRVTSVTPAVGQDTQIVTVKGQIENANNDPGVGGKKCVATFVGTYQHQ